MIPVLVSSLIKVLSAWLLMDLLTGIYHFVTDRGWNFKHQVDMFRDHHNTNTMLGFDWQPMVAGFPVLCLGVWIADSFLMALGSFAILAQIPHYYAHVPNPPAAIKLLQRWGLMITPAHHAGHHGGAFDTNFCIFTGWADYLLNPLARMLPAAPADLQAPQSGTPSAWRGSDNPPLVAVDREANRDAGRDWAGE